VTDQNGAVVSGANVRVTNADTNFSRTATSNEEGFYSFQLLPVGKYSVEITAQNFQAYKAETVVNITQTTVVDAQLGVSGDTVTVNVEAPVLQLETSQNGRTVEGETIRQLPLPTRNFQQLLTLQAGAQSSVSNTTELGRGDATISVNGQRTTSNSVRINGVDANSIGTLDSEHCRSGDRQFAGIRRADFALRRFERAQCGRQRRSDHAQRFKRFSRQRLLFSAR
jgi:hypothetical protein